MKLRPLAKTTPLFPLVKSKLNFTWYFSNKQHLALEICASDGLLQQDSAFEIALFFDPV
jgi:hypothetical protein